MTADARTEIRIFCEQQLAKGDVLVDLDPGDGALALATVARTDGPIAVLAGGLAPDALVALQDRAVERNLWIDGIPAEPKARLAALVQYKRAATGRVVAVVRATDVIDVLDRLAAITAAGQLLAVCVRDAAEAATAGFWLPAYAALQRAGFAPFEVLDHAGEPELFALAGAPGGAVIALHHSVTGGDTLDRHAQPTPAQGTSIVPDAPPAPRRERGVSFCIITDGRRPALLRETIASIQRLAIPSSEILVSGEPPADLAGVTCLDATDAARTGRLGAMRNRACRAARFDRVVVCDDDMFFHADFPAALDALDQTDVLCVRLLNPDGTRYWDWATHGGPRGHVLLDYTEQDPFVYVTGGLAIMHAHVHDRVPWHDDIGFYAGEDLDWSARLRAAGMRIAFSAQATVTHCDARYTQVGTGIGFRQDLTLRERVAQHVEGAGFFRPLSVGGLRWMSREGTLFVTARGPGQRLEVALGTTRTLHDGQPVAIDVAVNGEPVGRLALGPDQSGTFAVPLAVGTPTEVRLRADQGTPANRLGVPDPREASVALLHVGLADGDALP